MTVNHWVAGSSPAGGANRIFRSFTASKSKTILVPLPKTSGFSLKYSTFFGKTQLLFRFLAFFFLCSPIFSQPANSKMEPLDSLFASEQLLFITAGPGKNVGTLHFFEIRDGEWITVLEAIPVYLGRNGFVANPKKREGDGHTPTGFFPIKRILGKSKIKIPNLEYTQLRKYHHWNDQSDSKHYNQLISRYEKGAKPLWDSYIYELFIVIEHNTNPSLPGLGSMLFLHNWKEEKPTSGCIGVSKEHLETIISLLDGKKNPHLVLELNE